MNTIKTPFSKGAGYGLPMGLMMCVVFLSSVQSVRFPILSLLTLAMIIYLPIAVCRWMRMSHAASGGKSTVSELWMQGIMTFIFGSLICAVVSMAYLRWVEPDLIMTMVRESIVNYSQIGTPSANEIASVLRAMIDQNAVPTPGALSIAMFWLSVSAGSIISLPLALIARMRSLRSTRLREGKVMS